MDRNSLINAIRIASKSKPVSRFNINTIRVAEALIKPDNGLNLSQMGLALTGIIMWFQYKGHQLFNRLEKQWKLMIGWTTPAKSLSDTLQSYDTDFEHESNSETDSETNSESSLKTKLNSVSAKCVGQHKIPNEDMAFQGLSETTSLPAVTKSLENNTSMDILPNLGLNLLSPPLKSDESAQSLDQNRIQTHEQLVPKVSDTSMNELSLLSFNDLSIVSFDSSDLGLPNDMASDNGIVVKEPSSSGEDKSIIDTVFEGLGQPFEDEIEVDDPGPWIEDAQSQLYTSNDAPDLAITDLVLRQPLPPPITRPLPFPSQTDTYEINAYPENVSTNTAQLHDLNTSICLPISLHPTEVPTEGAKSEVTALTGRRQLKPRYDSGNIRIDEPQFECFGRTLAQHSRSRRLKKRNKERKVVSLDALVIATSPEHSLIDKFRVVESIRLNHLTSGLRLITLPDRVPTATDSRQSSYLAVEGSPGTPSVEPCASAEGSFDHDVGHGGVDLDVESIDNIMRDTSELLHVDSTDILIRPITAGHANGDDSLQNATDLFNQVPDIDMEDDYDGSEENHISRKYEIVKKEEYANENSAVSSTDILKPLLGPETTATCETRPQELFENDVVSWIERHGKNRTFTDCYNDMFKQGCLNNYEFGDFVHELTLIAGGKVMIYQDVSNDSLQPVYLQLFN